MASVDEKAPRARRGGKKPPKNPNGEMPLREHLKELRDRILKSAIAVVLGMVAGFKLYQPVFTAMIAPVVEAGQGRLTAINFDTVGSSFDIMLQVSAFIGVVIASPIWLYQAWAFVMPGLKKREKKYALGFLGASIPLFIGGLALGWLVMPQAVQFFFGLAPETTTTLIPAQTYIPFVLRLLLAFGVSLVLPVFLVGLNMLGILPAKTIIKHWRITVFVIALIAALAAPGTDAISMFYLAAPLFLLFAISILLCWMNDKRRARRNAATAKDVEAEIAAGPRSLDRI